MAQSQNIQCDEIKLPQNATSGEQQSRSDQLGTIRKFYIYESPSTIPEISFLKGPFTGIPDQGPSLCYRIRVGFIASKVLFNNILCANSMSFPRALVTGLSTMKDAILADPNDFPSLQNALVKVRQRLHQATNDIMLSYENDGGEQMKQIIDTRDNSTYFEELDEVLQPYRRFYKVYVRPPLTDVFMEDKIFARMRTAGFNPMTLFKVQSCNDIPFWIDADRLPCNSDEDGNVNQNISVSDAISKGLVYAVDLSFISLFNPDASAIPSPPSSAPSTASERTKLYIPSKALFAQPSRGKDLQPVAAYINGEVVYPTANDARWELAKMALTTCDAVHHELIAHLGRTHLLVEPFVAATYRQLPKQHPLFRLLEPHFEGTIFINDTAARDLVAPGGDIDRIFAGNITDVMKWTGQQILNTEFNRLFPDIELQSRGLLHSGLPFAYGDDVISHFNALHEWISDYLNFYYVNGDTDVINDKELKLWCEELTNEGKLKDFGDNGGDKIVSLKYLKKCITFIIFSASIQHAAVNFPQKDLMSYAPAVAGAQYSSVPKAGEEVDAGKWNEMLTPPRTALEQLDLLNMLGEVYYTELGQYNRGQFLDSKNWLLWPRELRIAHGKYMNRLKDIDLGIVEREKDQILKYHYLRPKNIPQSINI